MSKPRTLRSIAGLSSEPPRLTRSALVLIDLQQTYRSGVMRLRGVEPAIKEASRLLDRARSAGIPIIHVRHDGGSGSPYDLTTAAGQISPEVAPMGIEHVVTKLYPSSFVGTDLEARLNSAGVKDLVLAGFMTHMCVESTARNAFSLGFRPTVVATATATRDLSATDGSLVPAAVLQESSLAALTDMFATVVQSMFDIPD